MCQQVLNGVMRSRSQVNLGSLRSCKKQSPHRVIRVPVGRPRHDTPSALVELRSHNWRRCVLELVELVLDTRNDIVHDSHS